MRVDNQWEMMFDCEVVALFLPYNCMLNYIKISTPYFFLNYCETFLVGNLFLIICKTNVSDLTVFTTTTIFDFKI